MITRWSASSGGIILLRLVIISQLYHLTLICWIVLEIITWSLFFLFFIKYRKVLINHLFLFFIIQTSCRFIWLLRAVISKIEITGNLFIYLTIGLSLIVKIGLFPGHIWGLYIYNSSSIPVVFALSSFTKITPLIILAMWLTEYANEIMQMVLFYWVLLSYIIVIVNIWLSRNLFSFMFFSGIFHIRNMVLILIITSFLFFVIYYLTYVFILLSFITMYCYFNIDNLQRDYRFIDNSYLFLHLIRVAGFPPFPLFWFKLLILYKLWRDHFFVRNVSLVIVVVIFVYLLTLFMYIIKGWGCTKSSTTNWSVGYVDSIRKINRETLLPHFTFLFLPLRTIFVLL